MLIVRIILALALLQLPALFAQRVPVQEHILENGMKLLLLPRSGDPNIAAGWLAKVGAVNERPGITGVAHLFEHMMFKGTHTIGTRDIEEDLRIMRELDALKAKIRAEEAILIERQRRGEISDPKVPQYRSETHRRLQEEFNRLLARQRELLIPEDFSRTYSAQGASGLNAGTSNDFTVYFVNVPANKLELWFWMESDRLTNPVFREFYSERDVVHEERRLRIDSTPIGKFQEQFEALFWQSSPYGWPVVGWPSDLEGITREEALSFFDTYYAPNNLTAALIGDFNPEEAIRLAERYFGRLQKGQNQPEVPRTREMPQMAEKRMIAYAETNPQTIIRYHTVADGHVDEPALVVMGQILSGRTGRLQRSLVDDQKLATSASAFQNGMNLEGFFQLNAVARGDHPPEQLESALYEEIARLQRELVDERELQKVKNQNAASNFRELRSNFQLMFQLLIRDTSRGWETINTDPALYEAVTAEDVQRVADQYFAHENRTVAIYYRKGETAEEDPLLEGLEEDQRRQVRQFRAQVNQMNADQLRQLQAQLEQAAGQVPSEHQPAYEIMNKILSERLSRLESEQP